MLSSIALLHSFLQMYYQAFSMLGTAPLLIDITYDWAKLASIGPDSFLPFSILGLILLMTFLLRVITCSTKSALSSSNSIFIRFCKFSSLVRGLIMVQQSRSLKNCFKSLLILFFCSTLSEKPFWFSNAFSKYSLEVICSPSLSTSCKVKSLTTHMKDGK